MKKLFEIIAEDWRVNSHAKSKIVLLLFRIAHASGTSNSIIVRRLLSPYRIFYRFIVDWLFGIDLPWVVKMGRRIVLYHSFGLVINPSVVIGDDCILRHGVTIGNKIINGKETLCPKIGNRVEFGAGSVVLGDISIGDDVVIGAACVVTKSIVRGSVVAGNPFRILRAE